MESIVVAEVPSVLRRTAEAEEVQKEPADCWDSPVVDTALAHFRVLRMLLSGGSIR